MPEFRRFLTRAGEVYAEFRGSTDRLCSQRQMLHWPPRQQTSFMEAMREELAWVCLHSESSARHCWQSGVGPAQLRHYEDLQRLPDCEPFTGDARRETRRWDRVSRNCLADLGWSTPRRRALARMPDELAWFAQRLLVGRCSHGNWHWPRVCLPWKGRVYCPLLRSSGQLWVPLSEEIRAPQPCPCGRGPALDGPVNKFLTKSFSPGDLTSLTGV